MNKVFLLALALIPFQMRGQSVRFIEVDKMWCVKGVVLSVNPSYEIEEIYRFTAESDTLIDGVHYMRLFKEEDGKTSVAGIFREEGDIIYRYYPELQQEYVFYDFTLNLNSTRRLIVPQLGDKLECLCTATTVGIQPLEDGTKARKIKFISRYFRDENIIWEYPDNVWIEGIGNTCHPLLNVDDMRDGRPVYTVTCVKRGNDVIYHNHTASGIDEIKASKETHAYDLLGRPVAKDSQRGIIIQNGRKTWKK